MQSDSDSEDSFEKFDIAID